VITPSVVSSISTATGKSKLYPMKSGFHIWQFSS